MAADGMQKDWRELCVAVTNESDSTKLTSLVQELIEALDRGERSWRSSVCPPDTYGGESGSRLRASRFVADLRHELGLYPFSNVPNQHGDGQPCDSGTH